VVVPAAGGEGDDHENLVKISSAPAVTPSHREELEQEEQEREQLVPPRGPGSSSEPQQPPPADLPPRP
jgi:hypothetical protein